MNFILSLVGACMVFTAITLSIVFAIEEVDNQTKNPSQVVEIVEPTEDLPSGEYYGPSFTLPQTAHL